MDSPATRNPLRFEEDRILVEQLRLVLNNAGTSLLLMIVVVLLLVWALGDEGNTVALCYWGATVLLAKLALHLFSRRILASGVSAGSARRVVWILVAANLVYGAIWGGLVWVTLDDASLAEGILVMAVVAGVTNNGISIFSPVLVVALSFCLADLSVVAAKLWQMGDPAYQALATTTVLYVSMLVAEARVNSGAALTAIKLRFELEESHAKLHEAERRELLVKERQRMMQDMHDGLGSSLVSALRVVEHGEMDSGEMAQVLRGCLDDLKLVIDSMEPIEADLLLLLATFRYRLAPRLKSAGITLAWDVQKVPRLEWLDPKNALHILRILQEAITNVIKHTNATEIRIGTALEEHNVIVRVRDNGPGFDMANALRQGGSGLLNQMRRSDAIGAAASWESGGSGSCFTLRLPIQQRV